jgi:ABC-type uncharacterized transport system substrate-binding protein
VRYSSPRRSPPRRINPASIGWASSFRGLVFGSRRRKSLAELGLEEGKQFILHVREGQGDLKAVEKAAEGLEREKVELVYSVATSVTLVVKRASKTVRIVFSVGSDPVADGLVENFRKPGGRFTGTYNQATDLLAKGLPCPVRQS